MVTTFELPGCTDMWTVIGPTPKDQPEVRHAVESGQIMEANAEIKYKP